MKSVTTWVSYGSRKYSTVNLFSFYSKDPRLINFWNTHRVQYEHMASWHLINEPSHAPCYFSSFWWRNAESLWVIRLRQVKPEETCFTSHKSASFLVARGGGAGVKPEKGAVKSKFIRSWRLGLGPSLSTKYEF